jgi:hypothetical protein
MEFGELSSNWTSSGWSVRTNSFGPSQNLNGDPYVFIMYLRDGMISENEKKWVVFIKELYYYIYNSVDFCKVKIVFLN